MPRGHRLVRQATAKDSDAVFAMAESLATTFVLEFQSFDKSFNLIANDEAARILVAEGDNGLLDGYLLGFTHHALFANGSVGWIEEMYVNEPARRGGVGTDLERAFEEWAKARGATLIALATRRAASFYSAIGFEESATYFRKLL